MDTESISIRSNLVSDSTPSISKRKQSHIDICKAGSGSIIESSHACGFESIQFIHQALPELSYEEISTEMEFLGKTIRLPLFISCMTGGSEQGHHANCQLALAAQKMKLPIGLGSMRVLLQEPNRIKDFAMRLYAPDVPIIGNIGAVQMREIDFNQLKNLIKEQDLNALAIHLNCGQELFQKGGDRDFRGLKDAISKAINTLAIPIIVKETGFGINPFLVKELVAMGVAYVDLAGAGGTNWILVEHACNPLKNSPAEEFSHWGNGTAMLLDASRNFHGKVLASGGLRSGMDLAKAIALGAKLGGMALPFIRSALDGGSEAVCEQIEHYANVLKGVMMLTGNKSLSEFQNTPLIKSIDFKNAVSSLESVLK